MLSIASFAAAGLDTAAVLVDLDAQILAARHSASFVYAFYGCDHDDRLIEAYLRRRFAAAAVLGGTSCGGVMNQQRLWGAGSIGLLLIDDPDGDYGVGAARLGDDPAGSAETALRDALDDAECPGELPDLIWVFQAPGHEEEVIAGLRRIVGDRCPIIGGSSADNTVAGLWRQLGPNGIMTDGLVVGVLSTSSGIACSFQGGYEPTGASGIVTKARGRQILEIDGVPAAQVYNGWIGNILDGKLADGGNILLDTTMWPLATDAGQIDGVPNFLLIHPDAIMADGSLSTFASVSEGTRVHGMRGQKQQLVERAGRVAAQAAAALPGGAATLAGGLMVYCAGCMLAVDERMPDVVDAVAASFGGAPFLGCFTFGEQGYVADRNVHGNLMISSVAFGR
jgi:hypothetical protein